jgi:hypothetical protein
MRHTKTGRQVGKLARVTRRFGLTSLVLAVLPSYRLVAQARGAAIDSLALRAHTYFLSHDLLEGRGTGDRGADLAALYLATSAERLGLRGLTEAGGYLQPVPLVAAEIDTAHTRLLFTDSSGTHTAPSPAMFIPNAGTTRTLVDFSGGLAWVGSAAEVLAHPDRLPALVGRVVLMRGAFGAEAAAADTLRARGVTGVIQLVGDDDVYGLYARSRGESRMSVADSSTRSSFIPDLPAVIARATLVRRLLAPVISDDQLERPFLIEGRRVEVRVRVRLRTVAAQNVAAIQPGTNAARRGEYLVYTAHYDHLGMGEPDAHGDSIYNGFSDNAAGCAMLLALAQHFVAHPPERSVVFIWFTGEERGLLGSDYFAAHPLLPPGRITAVINLDAGAPPAPAGLWRVSGGDRSSLGPLAIAVARRAGWEAQTAPASPNTDYYPFLRLGVPAVFLVPGPGAYDGLTTDSSNALRRRWDHYHQAADHWAGDFPFAGLVRYADFALRLGLAVLAEPLLPRAVVP